ncbi:MAG: winged helix-turn-helix domain-containing protein [Candidatus Levyibacteriota bacterium]
MKDKNQVVYKSFEDLCENHYNEYMIPEQFESQYPDITRADEISKIVGYIKEGSSCQVVGIPGVSRSTLLGLFAYNKRIRQKHLGASEKKTHFILVDFSEIRNRDLFDAMTYLFLNLTESLRERGMMEENKVVGDKFREHLQFNDELVLFQGFKEAIDYMALEKKITMVFLFDRFEEYVPTVTSQFFANLRILRNRAKYHFSIVFSVNRPLENLLEPTLLAEYYEFVAGRIVYLPLHDEALSNFRLSYIEKITGKKLPPPILKELFALTDGHGKVTKLSVEALLANGIPEQLSEFLLLQKIVKAALNEIWRSLSPAEQAELLEAKFEDQDVDEYLEKVGLIHDKKIQIPLFAQFISSEYREAAKTTQKIVYDENTNEIRKGTIVLSDQLTSSEFRLLRFLLQNQERIIERDELIGVVWQGNKSTAGITDQAVDQLIFRLRRKIEEDPNNPLHLQTVKGRGFKFVN